MESLRQTGRLAVCDTSTAAFGVCAEVARLVATTDPRVLSQPVINIGLEFTPCPTGKTLEDFFYPNVRQITRSVLGLLDLPFEENQLPEGSSYRDYYRLFRGPF
jgi:pyruvate dehydrogenase E1 component beta subunit